MSSSSSKSLSLTSLSLFTPLHLSFLFLHLTILVTGDPPPPYVPLDSIALDCGSSSDSIGNARNWTADINSRVALLDQDGPSTNSTANGASTSSVPYHTARVSLSKFTYTFRVNTTGPKFVRLYFNPASYTGLNRSKASFSVTTRRYTFLSNFSGFHYTDPLGERGYAREFILNVEDEKKNLSITFTPSPHVADAYAFINGIEIVSMPTNLYYTAGDNPELYNFDQGVYLPLQNETALEIMYRVNVGWKDIPPPDDNGMFRSWLRDVDYLTDARPSALVYNDTIQLQYNHTRYAAPDVLYRNARTMGNDSTVNEKYNMTWEFPVHSTFTYLVRLHFCQFMPILSQKNDMIFQIYIANQTAERNADIISWADGYGVPIYKDYVVMMDAGGNEGIQNLSIALHPSQSAIAFDAMLNGAEIFKLSKSDNLSGPNPDAFPDSPASNTPSATSTKPKHSRRRTVAIIGAAVSGIVVVSVLFLLIFRRRVRKFKDLVSGDAASNISPLVSSSRKSTKTHRPSLPSDLCYRFSLVEIIAATNNFDDSFIIGVGGFGNVYKGLFDGGVNRAAIKRLNPSSRQGATEFRTEIEMLSQLRFRHLVSLIGYCNDNNEMILVYDYMARGTLRDHLYRTDNPPLSWTQRLEICIGAARGLDYLHTGAKHTVIHRDVKTTNILLDEKWVAKVSDFGLSKTGPTSTSKGHVSTVVKGSIGYLDPEYCQRQQLTEKSDVYSFGVVLFEVLCARPAINRSAVPASLAELARQSHSNGTINEIIDPYLDGKISPDCLKNFVDVAVRCLLENGIERPSMTDVVWGLEFALQLQESVEEYVIGAQTEKEVDMVTPLKGSSIDDSSNLFSTGSELVVNSRILEMATTSSSDGQSFLSNESEKMMSGAVFSEIMNPEGR
ncbi:receptor-like protein kinase FERONIA [Populus alba]|uniref:receptor-like protein kinase FERONIA n=1 Tax=Populus alba TaxID=43335 RepID=UPI00158F0234|nr:receptor-like protein kinase FERONIA [Populus alba]